jgi:hypothetical protein
VEYYSSMLIVLEFVSLVKFLSWLQEQPPMLLIFSAGLPKLTGKNYIIYLYYFLILFIFLIYSVICIIIYFETSVIKIILNSLIF